MRNRGLLILIVCTLAAVYAWHGFAIAEGGRAGDDESSSSVDLKMFTPRSGDVAGKMARAWFVDLRARFDGDLVFTGATPELTGPGAHINVTPFPGDFSPGADPSFPGLVVLVSSRGGNPGPPVNANLANLFNLVGITNRTDDETEIWATWIIGAPGVFGALEELTESTLFVAIVETSAQNPDAPALAPNMVNDMNGDGEHDEDDLELMGFNVISQVRRVDFVVNGF